MWEFAGWDRFRAVAAKTKEEAWAVLLAFSIRTTAVAKPRPDREVVQVLDDNVNRVQLVRELTVHETELLRGLLAAGRAELTPGRHLALKE